MSLLRVMTFQSVHPDEQVDKGVFTIHLWKLLWLAEVGWKLDL